MAMPRAESRQGGDLDPIHAVRSLPDIAEERILGVLSAEDEKLVSKDHGGMLDSSGNGRWSLHGAPLLAILGSQDIAAEIQRTSATLAPDHP
jgi:hypothetical protein